MKSINTKKKEILQKMWENEKKNCLSSGTLRKSREAEKCVLLPLVYC